MPKAREPNPEIDGLAERVMKRARGSLACNLREQRARARKTQERVAEEIGVSAIYVQALERGAEENPTLRVLALLAHALGCSIAELVASRAAPRPAAMGRPRARPLAEAEGDRARPLRRSRSTKR